MPRHAKPIDPGPSALLTEDLAKLTPAQLGALLCTIRDAGMSADGVYEQTRDICVNAMANELHTIYAEVRQTFVREFFAVKGQKV